jgi:hypothetical protein
MLLGYRLFGNVHFFRGRSLRLVSLTDQIRRVQGIFKDIAPGVSLAEELIQERRAEAQRELEQW